MLNIFKKDPLKVLMKRHRELKEQASYRLMQLDFRNFRKLEKEAYEVELKIKLFKK